MNVKYTFSDNLFPNHLRNLDLYFSLAEEIGIEADRKKISDGIVDCKPEDLKNLECMDDKLEVAHRMDEILRLWDKYELVKIFEEKIYEFWRLGILIGASKTKLVSKIRTPNLKKFQQYIEELRLRLKKSNKTEIKNPIEKTNDVEKIEKTESKKQSLSSKIKGAAFSLQQRKVYKAARQRPLNFKDLWELIWKDSRDENMKKKNKRITEQIKNFDKNYGVDHTNNFVEQQMKGTYATFKRKFFEKLKIIHPREIKKFEENLPK